MYNLYWKGKTYNLPVTEEEWTHFVLADGDSVVAEICDYIDSIDIHTNERWHIITKFNKWLIINQDKLEYTKSWDEFQVSLELCPCLVYCVHNDIDQTESANDFILWQRGRDRLLTK